jgi:hypothetical protein
MVGRLCCHWGVAEDLLSAEQPEFGWLDSATSVQFALRPAEQGSVQGPFQGPIDPVSEGALPRCLT